MAKFNPGSIISEIRGSIGDDTYSRNAFGPYVKQKLTQTVRNTSYQITIRDAITEANVEYKLLSDDDFKTWSEFVEQHLKSNGLSNRIRISAYNEFCSRYVNRALLGSSSTGFSAEPACNQFSRITNLVASGGTLTGDILTENFDGSTSIAVYATEPLSPTIRSISPSIYNFIGTISVSSDFESVDLTTLYVTRYPEFGDGTVKRIGIVIKNIRNDNFSAGTKFYTNVLSDGTFPAEATTEYQAIITYANSQAFTLPSTKVQYFQNLLIIALQNLGAWALLDTFYNFYLDNNKAFSRINWKSPGSFTLTENGTVTFTAFSGINGSSGNYWKTGYSPQADGVHFTQNSGSVFCYVASQTTINATDFGARITAGSRVFIAGYTGTTNNSARGIANRSGAGLISPGWAPGLTMATSQSSSIRILRRNANSPSSVSDTSLTPPNFEMYVCAENQSGTAVSPSGNLIQMCGTGGNMDSLEFSMKTAFDLYKTSIA